MTLSIRHNKNYPFIELSEEKFTNSEFNNQSTDFNVWQKYEEVSLGRKSRCSDTY